jgi:hypothetical protein
MSSFFDDDINSEDVRSPNEILSEAGVELESRTRKLSVAISEDVLDDRVVLGFVIKNKDHQMALKLFEVMHRREYAYPVSINPPPSQLPEFLQKRRYKPGTPGIAEVMADFSSFGAITALQGTPGRFVDNEWVCSTPREFMGKLKELFSKDYVKSLLISIIAPSAGSSPQPSEGTMEEPLTYDNVGIGEETQE